MTLEERVAALEAQMTAATQDEPTEYYTSRWSGEEIDKGINGALQLGGATTTQAALRNIGGRPNRNLLDNWYFVGGGSQQGGGEFPINQRGKTSYIGNAGYFIDRWLRKQNINVTIGANGLTITPIGTDNPTIFQVTANSDAFFGKAVTLSVLLADGTFYTTTGTYSQKGDIGYNIAYTETGFGNLSLQYQQGYGPLFVIDGSNQVEFTLLAAKLELGPTQTLAYQDEDGAWQLFEAPDYGDQLRRCQRYFQRIKASSSYMRFGVSTPYSSTSAGVFIPLLGEMRKIPVVSFGGNFALFDGQNFHPVTLSSDTLSPYNAILTASGSTQPTKAAQLLAYNDSIAYIDFSADL